MISLVDVGPNVINGIDAFFVCEKIIWEIVEPIGIPIPIIGTVDPFVVVDQILNEIIGKVGKPVEVHGIDG